MLVRTLRRKAGKRVAVFYQERTRRACLYINFLMTAWRLVLAAEVSLYTRFHEQDVMIIIFFFRLQPLRLNDAMEKLLTSLT